jgi:hypothetical protein
MLFFTKYLGISRCSTCKRRKRCKGRRGMETKIRERTKEVEEERVINALFGQVWVDLILMRRRNIIDTVETRRRFDADDEKQKMQYVGRGRDEIGTVDKIEERRTTGISDRKYQDHSNLVKLLNTLRKEKKVLISIIYDYTRDLPSFS